MPEEGSAPEDTPTNAPTPSSPPKESPVGPDPILQGSGHGPSGGSALTKSLTVLIVVMVVAGAGTFLALSAIGPSSVITERTGPSQCRGNLLGCGSHPDVHDATVFSPLASTETDTPATFTATIPNGVISSATFYFGDGTNATVTNPSPSVVHTYQSPGYYLIYAVVEDTSGTLHDNLDHVTPLEVVPSYLTVSGNTAQVGGNASSTTVSPGGSVSLIGRVLAPPSNAGWRIASEGFLSQSSSIALSACGCSNTTSLASTTASVSTGAPDGIYMVIFYTESTNGVGAEWSNYTYSLGVGISLAVSTEPSPHPGVADVYYLLPGGSFSEDPAIDYESAGGEPIFNVFQTLITNNGSLVGPYPNDYVPDLATCVPGSTQCQQLYGNSLFSGYNYTFVINPKAEFYNPTTGLSSGVFPIDVLYSMVRTCLFATYPAYETNPGWIQCQALLPAGNATWDAEMHFPLNSTPANILNSMVMNESGYCPPSATNGCITFNTEYSGHAWPDFLEFISDAQGAGIVDCDYATSLGNSIPGLPCSATSDPVASGPTAWDPVQLGIGSSGGDYTGTTASWANALRWDMVGSGPYYLAELTPGTGYTVKASPAWKGTSCNWAGCLPVTFPLQTVNVVWESEAVQGEVAFQAGQADIVNIPATDFSSVLLPMIHAGQAVVTSAPSLNIFFTNFDMYFSQTGAESLLTGTGATLNAPSDLFQDLAFRQFLIHAFPYATVQSQYNTIDGIPLDELYGGAIPIGMANYYPMNISWDFSDPSASTTSPADAGYWWALDQATDGIAAQACRSADPCVFPLLSYAGAPLQDEIMNAWISQITKLSDGAVVPVKVDIPFINLVINSFAPPGTNPMPVYELGWAPDYPDPTDYILPIYAADGTYTYGDALCEAWIATSQCAGRPVNAANYDNPCPVGYVWANASVTSSCQGTAYSEMNTLIQEAAFDTNSTQRAFLYNELEHIAQQLGIFVPNPGQQISQWISAPWIDSSSLNENPAGGNGWYNVQYV